MQRSSSISSQSSLKHCRARHSGAGAAVIGCAQNTVRKSTAWIIPSSSRAKPGGALRRRATRLFNLPHHSPCRVKAIKRPKTMTRTQRAIDIPPASLARGGGVRLRFHFCTSRTVMNSKMNMLIPARTMSDILIQNVAFTKYSVADCEQDQTWPHCGPCGYWDYFAIHSSTARGRISR